MARQWIKLDADFYADDRVLELLSDGDVEPDRAMRFATVFVFLGAAMLSRRIDAEGEVTYAQLVGATSALGLSDSELDRAVERLIDVGLFERGKASGPRRRPVRVTAWSKWQGDADASRERRARDAERKRTQRRVKRESSPTQAVDKPESSAAQEPESTARGEDVRADAADASAHKRREEKIREEESGRPRTDADVRAPTPEEQPPKAPVAERLFEVFGWRVDLAECEELAEWGAAKGVPDDDLIDCARLNPWPSDVRSELRHYDPRVQLLTYDRERPIVDVADADIEFVHGTQREIDAAQAAAVEAERNNADTAHRVADIINIARGRVSVPDDDAEIGAKQQAARDELARMGDDEPW